MFGDHMFSLAPPAPRRQCSGSPQVRRRLHEELPARQVQVAAAGPGAVRISFLHVAALPFRHAPHHRF